MAVSEQHRVVDERLRRRDQPRRLREQAGQPRVGGGFRQPPALLCRGGRELGRALRGGRGGGERVPGSRPRSRLLELCGNRLVRFQRGSGQMPGIPVDLAGLLQRVGERPVNRAALRERRRAVNGRADQRMPEPNL